ncbi:hypothetical protein [Deinococcus ficus]|uniref:Uncharacterized protein n=1 Tax=Deinococcus ficus TaxID=317577 RepID=A0A221T2P6_9DEIO|nr:hypothetical protein [Deinococcus ficus]ASN83169.1 hypothetical protein DFI_18385 [Deinococcus ficus]
MTTRSGESVPSGTSRALWGLTVIMLLLFIAAVITGIVIAESGARAPQWAQNLTTPAVYAALIAATLGSLISALHSQNLEAIRHQNSGALELLRSEYAKRNQADLEKIKADYTKAHADYTLAIQKDLEGVKATYLRENQTELERIKAQYSSEHQAVQQTISLDLAKFQSALQHEFAQLRAVTENEAKYAMLRRSVLDAGQAVLPRLKEVVKGHGKYGYEKPWASTAIQEDSPEANKRDTTVFRLFRFFGAYRRYRRITDWEHPIANDLLMFFFEGKIEPVFASGSYPDCINEGTVIWRETIAQLGLLMIDASSDRARPDLLSWLAFCSALRGGDQRAKFLDAQAERISQFLALPYQRTGHPAVRVALLGVYLCDMCMVCDPQRKYIQSYRPVFLQHILNHTEANNGLYLYVRPGPDRLSDLDCLRKEYAARGQEALNDERAAPPVRFNGAGEAELLG